MKRSLPETFVLWLCLVVYPIHATGCFEHAGPRVETVTRAIPHNVDVQACVDKALEVRGATGDGVKAGEYFDKCLTEAGRKAGKK